MELVKSVLKVSWACACSVLPYLGLSHQHTADQGVCRCPRWDAMR